MNGHDQHWLIKPSESGRICDWFAILFIFDHARTIHGRVFIHGRTTHTPWICSVQSIFEKFGCPAYLK